MLKVKLFLIINIIVVLLSVNTVFASNTKTGRIVSQIVRPTDYSNTIEVSGSKPVLTGFTKTDFQTSLNKQITAYYDEILSANRNSKYVKKITFLYDVKTYDDVTSVIINVAITSSTTRNRVKAFTFNNDVGQQYYLTSAKFLGTNGLNVAGDLIKSTIMNQPDKYNITFKKITDDSDFYIEVSENTKDTILHVIYLDQKFEMNLKNLNSYTGTVTTLAKYRNVKWVPLREVSEALGYTIKWNDKTRSIDITKDGTVASLVVGKNQYTKQKPQMVLELEESPIIEGSTTLVPVSFFERVLETYYSIDGNDGTNVTFTSYTK